MLSLVYVLNTWIVIYNDKRWSIYIQLVYLLFDIEYFIIWHLSIQKYLVFSINKLIRLSKNY